ncbi:hypothetical protein EVAR_47611_1 [Eumeta japonica]|uniref:Uncharacterized protein n=1 Tax=Eumeta variegata TaxID=151549 RepID=A0A4C1WNA1_EUMVA|nr:hypothetical protein EVAR_47611_1 [Eumeta japonica]
MRGGYQNFNIFVRVCMDRRFLTPASSAICEHTAARRVTVRPAGVPCAACTVCVDGDEKLYKREQSTHRSYETFAAVLLGTARRFVLACDSSLVDPASSYMLVSKTKPCMSQCKPY